MAQMALDAGEKDIAGGGGTEEDQHGSVPLRTTGGVSAVRRHCQPGGVAHAGSQSRSQLPVRTIPLPAPPQPLTHDCAPVSLDTGVCSIYSVESQFMLLL